MDVNDTQRTSADGGMAKRSSNSSIAGPGPITKRKCHGERITVVNRAGKNMLEIKHEGAESAEVALLLYGNVLFFFFKDVSP